MAWWQAWILFVVSALVLGTMCDSVLKAIREVRDEVNRLRIATIDLAERPTERDETYDDFL